MAFDARKAVNTLDWSFAPYHPEHSGVVPEPTDDELRAMNKKLRDAMVKVTGEDFNPEDQAAVVRAFSKLTDEQNLEMEEGQLDAICLVTKNSPSREVLIKVGPRLRRAFSNWLVKELNQGEG